MDDPWLDIDAAASYTAYSVSRLRELLERDHMHCDAQLTPDKRSRRWRRSTIDAWMAATKPSGVGDALTVAQPRQEVQPERARKSKPKAAGEPDLSLYGQAGRLS